MWQVRGVPVMGSRSSFIHTQNDIERESNSTLKRENKNPNPSPVQSFQKYPNIQSKRFNPKAKSERQKKGWDRADRSKVTYRGGSGRDQGQKQVQGPVTLDNKTAAKAGEWRSWHNLATGKSCRPVYEGERTGENDLRWLPERRSAQETMSKTFNCFPPGW